ncbi:MAG TPA: endolytic transglycosylase MltG [Mycobacteriales bacterium]|nr:endolytic transglycosylase MltG [Mycobacteriales bacterium]
MSGLGFGMSDDQGRSGASRNRRGLALAVVLFLVIVVVAGLVLAGPMKSLFGGGNSDYPGDGTGNVLVEVHQGDSTSTIGERLAQAGVVRSASIFTSAAALNPRSRDIQPGTYRLHEHMKASLALALILNPKSLVSYRVTIPEGFTAAAIVARIAADTPISASALNAVLRNPAALHLPTYANGQVSGIPHVEGFLFPATYEIAPGETATQALSAMVTRFDQAAAQVGLAAGAKRLGLSPYAVLTLASIVQREGRLIQDYPKIAEVFINRLHDDMPLGSDATLYYVLGPNHGPLTAHDLAMKTPYNTRINRGLPPTPINSPGVSALDAVLHHPNGPLLYFVTIDKAGHTAFATTLQRFNQLVEQSRANGVS